jgi:organic radical activating enzyme
MSNLKTQINWMLHDHCTSECTYCPTRLRGGELPRGILEYMEVTKKIIDHYDSLGRKINWTFNGGEPLDMFDFPMMLKLCKEQGGTIDLTTNGGKLWLDWWAIEPHIDSLHLSYHYWQNPNLIRFIIQAFQKAGKHIDIMVPMRPNYFNEDLARALAVESEFNIVVSKNVLYKEADQSLGMYAYTEEQLRIMRGEELVQEYNHEQETTFGERFEEKVNSNPSYTGQLCNLGIEKLTISHTGWVRGSNCNSPLFGNIWNGTLGLPTGPSQCVMMACIDGSDQQITKFSQ